ncbi:hypothetical protein [Clostridium sp.]
MKWRVLGDEIYRVNMPCTTAVIVNDWNKLFEQCIKTEEKNF